MKNWKVTITEWKIVGKTHCEKHVIADTYESEELAREAFNDRIDYERNRQESIKANIFKMTETYWSVKVELSTKGQQAEEAWVNFVKGQESEGEEKER